MSDLNIEEKQRKSKKPLKENTTVGRRDYPVPNSLISPINSTDCAANSTSNGNASGDSSQAAVPGHL